MSGLSVILKESLPNLIKLYEANKPLHAITTVAIGHFIERFNKKPEWEKKVTFLSLNNWKETGTFAMVNTNENLIFFNTFEPWPHESLRRTLNLLNYDKPVVFVCFRDVFRSVVLDVIRVQNLEITFDSGTKNMFVPYKDVNIKINPPDGYYFDSLNQNHVEKINSIWVQRFSGSYDFLSNCIEMNPSTGLFDNDTGELVAWNMMMETGAAGNLHVDEKYRRKGFGQIVANMQMTKMMKERGCDIVGHVVHYNKASLNLVNKMGFQWIDNNSWIGVRPKPLQKVLPRVPLWGF